MTTARQSSLCIKPNFASSSATSPPATGPDTPSSLTTKQWIIPPRPKPGRKPATDTPPTKRKAQNRAAQRAFRERRAARVGELEDQIKQTEQEHEDEKNDLRDEIKRLQSEAEANTIELSKWLARCRNLEQELAQYSQSSSNNNLHVGPASDGEGAIGCGNCTFESRCQCIDEAFSVQNVPAHTDDLASQNKRSRSSGQGTNHKRIKSERQDELEIDFTHTFSKQSVTASKSDDPIITPDPCGFCQDGTPCICAEMAAEQRAAEGNGQQLPALPQLLPSISSLSHFTPPPSESDIHNQIAASNPCASGPGTCAQCRADPNSTIFCKSLAASRAQSGLQDGGCCGGASANGSCCKEQQSSVPGGDRTTRSKFSVVPGPTDNLPTQSRLTVTCADAYTSLSRHPAYHRATGELSSWMPKLHPTDVNLAGRPGFEIDAANVMAVLKEFDRRFGDNC